MKKYLSILTVFMIFTAEAQDLGQLLELHYNSVGFLNLKDVETIRYKGEYKNHYLKIFTDDLPKNIFNPEVEITVLRNKGYLLQVFNKPDHDSYRYFLNKYWKKDQAGKPALVWEPSNIDRLLIQLFTDMEGFLYDWKKKGVQLKKFENVRFNKTVHYRIRAITPEKDTLFYYINTKTNVLEKISFGGDITEGNHYNNITFSDYKEVKGVQIAFKQTQNFKSPDGTFGVRELIFHAIMINPEINNSIFEITNSK